jgi:ComF family protein
MDALSCALLPASCALCGSPLPQLSHVPICSVCWTEFPLQTTPACAICGDTLDVPISNENPASVSFCRTCRLTPPPYVRAVSHGLYQDRLKAAIHALKYDLLHPAARELGRMLALAIAQLADEAPAEMLVVPITLHRSKYQQRGFNQVRALAEHALRFLRKSHPQWSLTLANSALMRHRSTESQAGLTLRGRRMNVSGAFTVSNPAAIDSKDILLVDDIFTTGATARAAAQVLIRAGAASVWVATLARARRLYEINQKRQSGRSTGRYRPPRQCAGRQRNAGKHLFIAPFIARPTIFLTRG